MHLGNALEVCAEFEDESIDVLLADPPYSKHVHDSVRSAKRNEQPDVAEFECRTRRVVDLGFKHLSAAERRAFARLYARLVKRWIGVFCDTESAWLWRLSLRAVGLDYVRTCEWERIGGAPQFSGDRPAVPSEDIVFAHPRGRKHWNGGGHAGRYSHAIVANRLGARGERVHETQKPLGLMLNLVGDFTDEGDLVLDTHAGSGTTGVACVRKGRRFVGVELNPHHFETACERLHAESRGLSLPAARAGQLSLLEEK